MQDSHNAPPASAANNRDQPAAPQYTMARTVIAQRASVLIILASIRESLLFDLLARQTVAAFAVLVFFHRFDKLFFPEVGPIGFCEIQFGVRGLKQ